MMRCGLRVPEIGNAFHVSTDPPELTANLKLRWPASGRALNISMFVDTGCSVDMIASPRLAKMIRAATRPIRKEPIDWGGTHPCDVFAAEVLTDRWQSAEIYAPLDVDCEDLLGLPLVLRSNLCIRGEAGAAFWVEMSDPRDPHEWVGRDADQPPEPAGSQIPTRPRRRTRRRA